MYLKNRSLLIKQAVRELKIVDVTLTFVQQLTRIVFTHLVDVGRDFAKLFADSPGCLAGSFSESDLARMASLVLLVWESGELKNYVTQLLRHVFDPGPGLAVIGQCVRLARMSALQVCAHSLNARLSAFVAGRDRSGSRVRAGQTPLDACGQGGRVQSRQSPRSHSVAPRGICCACSCSFSSLRAGG